MAVIEPLAVAKTPDPLFRLVLNDRAYSVRPQRFLLESLARLIPPPRGVKYRPALCYDVPAKWVEGFADENRRVILYLHGGAYMMGSVRSHQYLTAYLCRVARADGLIIDYRRTPEHPFPAALEDALTAYMWLLGQGVDARRIALSGDSAGGGLCLCLMLALRDAGKPLPAAAYLMSPWTDLTPSNRRFPIYPSGRTDIVDWGADALARMYCCDQDPSHPYISPVYGDLSGLPPMMIAAGRHEPLRHDARRVAERAMLAGVEVVFDPYQGPIHVFQAFSPVLRRSHRLLARGGRFLRSHCPANG